MSLPKEIHVEPRDGGHAFPRAGSGQYGHGAHAGISLRDWFAGQEQLTDCLDASEAYWEAVLGEKAPKWQDDRAGWIAFEARARARLKLMRADAMLAERTKGGAR